VHYLFARLLVVNPKITLLQKLLDKCGLKVVSVVEDVLNIMGEFNLILYGTDFIHNYYQSSSFSTSLKMDSIHNT